MKKTIKIYLGCLLIVSLGIACFLAVVFFYFNWGFWRSESYKLIGVELPLRNVYMTDLTGRGREAGFFVVAHELPENTVSLLQQNKIDLSRYPIFVAGFERDGFKRMNWAKGFPRNEIEGRIYQFFKREYPELGVMSISEIRSDDDAIKLANILLRDPDTLCGGWYKDRNINKDIWATDFYYYVMNTKYRILIMFGLST